MLQRLARTCLLALFGVVGVLDLVFAVKTPVWHPRDEIAHYDFIDQIGDLRLPAPDHQISDYTSQLCRERFDWYKPKRYDGTKETMGLAGWSYEAQNPPLYYLLLAGPNRLMKAAGIEPGIQLASLRVLTALMFLAGAAVLVAVFDELSQLVDISPLTGPLLAVVAAATNVTTYSTLGNDALSLLMSALTVYCCVLFWKHRRARELLVGFLAASFGGLVKVTALPLLALPVLTALAVQWVDRAKRDPPSRLNARRILAAASPTLLMVLFFALNYVRFGAFLGSSAARNRFATFVKPVVPDVDFVKSLVLNSFDLQHVSIRIPPAVAACFIGLVLVNLVVCAVIVVRRRCPLAAIQLSCCVITVGVAAVAVALNRFIPGVHWHAFRHYFAALPFWWFAVLPLSLVPAGPPLRLFQVATVLVLVAYLGRFLLVLF